MLSIYNRIIKKYLIESNIYSHGNILCTIATLDDPNYTLFLNEFRKFRDQNRLFPITRKYKLKQKYQYTKIVFNYFSFL